jgi:hypothetical protein
MRNTTLQFDCFGKGRMPARLKMAAAFFLLVPPSTIYSSSSSLTAR